MAPDSTNLENHPPLQLLLVEDDDDEQFLFRIAANKTQLNFRIQSVSSGAEALDYLQGVFPYTDRALYPLPELIVLDLKLPVMTGIELLRWLRTSPQFQSVPVIAVSGSPEPGLQAQARALGAGKYLEKPFGMDKWVAMVRQIWEFARVPLLPTAPPAGTSSLASV